MTDVLILGAGFSKAVSSAMPMTGELGEELLARLASLGLVSTADGEGITGPLFESWLSQIAEPQPYLDASDNARNRSLFLRASAILREILVERQADAHRGEVPWWLLRLLGSLHYSTSTLVTFNYDTLVETAVDTAGLFDRGSNHVSSGEILRHMPPSRQPPASGMNWGTPRSRTFRYIKLHGSVDTFWIPNDKSGASIGRWVLPGLWGSPQVAEGVGRRQVLPATEPYIVPPAAAKSSFYANPLAQELWRSAAEALKKAKDVAILGYSIPMTDLVTRGMLSASLGDSESLVTIVDRAPASVAPRLIELGVAESRIRQVDGENCVQRFAESLDEQTRLESDTSADGHQLLVVGDAAFPKLAVDSVLANDSGRARLAVGTSPWESASVTVNQLLVAGDLPRQIEIVFENGQSAFVAQAKVYTDGPGAGRFLVLNPTAHPQWW